MADHDLTSRLLESPSSDQREPVVDVCCLESGTLRQHALDNHTQNHIQNHRGHCDSAQTVSRHPFECLGLVELSVPASNTVNPFLNGTLSVDGVYEALKIVVCLPIALIRLVLFGLALAVGYVATRLALEGWSDKQNPMPKWRRRIMWITRLSARCILFSFGYHWIRRKGKPAPREIAPVVVSNHVSYIEPIYYFYELFPTIVASESHDTMPFVGTIIRAMQVIYVDRFSQSSRKNAVNEIKRKASCDRFPRLLLFPEGTTTNGKVLISFQLGAFIHGFAVQPIVVRYPHVHFDQSWGDISLSKLMFRMFTQFHNFMEIEYLPIVYPRDSQKENAFHFAERTSHAMAAALNVVQTFHSFGDVMLLTKASELKLAKPSSYMVEMARAESLFHVSSLEAVDFLETFASMNPDSSGRVTRHGFLKLLRLKPCALPQEIFRFLDLEKRGSISFKQACELAFSECDADKDSYITAQDLGDAIKDAVPELTKAEVKWLFDLFDPDDDGRVSQNDFLACLKRNPLLLAIFSPILLR